MIAFVCFSILPFEVISNTSNIDLDIIDWVNNRMQFPIRINFLLRFQVLFRLQLNSLLSPSNCILNYLFEAKVKNELCEVETRERSFEVHCSLKRKLKIEKFMISWKSSQKASWTSSSSYINAHVLNDNKCYSSKSYTYSPLALCFHYILYVTRAWSL